jgi:hypothetical protein
MIEDGKYYQLNWKQQASKIMDYKNSSSADSRMRFENEETVG